AHLVPSGSDERAAHRSCAAFAGATLDGWRPLVTRVPYEALEPGGPRRLWLVPLLRGRARDRRARLVVERDRDPLRIARQRISHDDTVHGVARGVEEPLGAEARRDDRRPCDGAEALHRVVVARDRRLAVSAAALVAGVRVRREQRRSRRGRET